MLAKLTATQAATLIAARGTSDYNRKQVKRTVFAAAKAAFGIPSSTKLRVELDDTTDPNYLVLRHKHTGTPITVPDAPGTSTPTPLPTPATVNQADTAVDTKVADAPAAAPAAFRFVVVSNNDVFFNPNSDEVVVRIPA